MSDTYSAIGYANPDGSFKETGNTAKKISNIASAITYDNTQSGLQSNRVQGAIDEVQGEIEELNSNSVWSADETRIGTWYDGRTRYRKVLVSTQDTYLNVDNDYNIPIDTTNIDISSVTISGGIYSNYMSTVGAFISSFASSFGLQPSYLRVIIPKQSSSSAAVTYKITAVLEYCHTTS